MVGSRWASTLIDNPRVLPVVDAIWGHSRCELLRCGMNVSSQAIRPLRVGLQESFGLFGLRYCLCLQGSFPGSLDQGLHIDLGAHAFDDTFTELPIQVRFECPFCIVPLSI